ncbi:MAG: DUF3422 family protein [Alphaproteobacteria bacterium]
METTERRGFGHGGALAAALTDHPQRRELAAEVHARPHPRLETPVRVSHLALYGEGEVREAERVCLEALCRRFDVEPPPPHGNHFTAEFGRFRLRWERHTEFSTYTFFRFDPFDDPFTESAVGLVPAAWLDSVPGKVMAAVHVAVERRWLGAESRSPHGGCETHFSDGLVVGSGVSGGAAQVWTDFQIRDDGFSRVLIHNLGLTTGQTGRLVQRLLEIETYRMMALLALPLARETSRSLDVIEQRVAGIVAELAEVGRRDLSGERDRSDEDRRRLGNLSLLAAETERLTNTGGYRFDAAAAYHAIVRRRIEALREVRLPGVQTIAEFMERRLSPAMQTCEAVARRQVELSRRVARAGDLLRTRVNIMLEENNRDLLRSMNRRAALQLRLQEAVEGLSVVAISYYALALLGYAIQGLESLGLLPVEMETAQAVAMPVVVVAAVLSLRRLRHGCRETEDGSGNSPPSDRTESSHADS